MSNRTYSPKFWTWLVRGDNSRLGFWSVVDRWLLFHIFVGLLLAAMIPMSIEDVAGKALFPLAAILIGLTFSWSGNAQVMLADPEIEAMVLTRESGISAYVYRFQLGIFITLLAVVSWGLASTGLFKWLDITFFQFDETCGLFGNSILSVGVLEFSLYALASLCLRTCWQVVLGSQALLLTRFEIRKYKNELNDKNKTPPTP